MSWKNQIIPIPDKFETIFFWPVGLTKSIDPTGGGQVDHKRAPPNFFFFVIFLSFSFLLSLSSGFLLLLCFFLLPLSNLTQFYLSNPPFLELLKLPSSSSSHHPFHFHYHFSSLHFFYFLTIFVDLVITASVLRDFFRWWWEDHRRKQNIELDLD